MTDTKPADTPAPAPIPVVAGITSSSTMGEYFSNWIVRIRAGDTGALPVIAGLIILAVIFEALNGNFLTAVRKLPLSASKITARIMSPAITGSAPVSPARIRTIQLLKYSPIVLELVIPATTGMGAGAGVSAGLVSVISGPLP